tara:strand:+ start:739 stop:1191 length:453 start_codon:yes stop_codon:yes gene_type:complete
MDSFENLTLVEMTKKILEKENDYYNTKTIEFDILEQFLLTVEDFLYKQKEVSCLSFCSGIYGTLMGKIKEHIILDKNVKQTIDDIFYNSIDEIKDKICLSITQEENYNEVFHILFLLVVYHTYLQAKKNKNVKERITNYKLLKKVWLDLV